MKRKAVKRHFNLIEFIDFLQAFDIVLAALAFRFEQHGDNRPIAFESSAEDPDLTPFTGGL